MSQRDKLVYNKHLSFQFVYREAFIPASFTISLVFQNPSGSKFRSTDLKGSSDLQIFIF